MTVRRIWKTTRGGGWGFVGVFCCTIVLASPSHDLHKTKAVTLKIRSPASLAINGIKVARALPPRIVSFFVRPPLISTVPPIPDLAALTSRSPLVALRGLLDHARRRLFQVWYEGVPELYVTGYAWHNRYCYDADRLSAYNELSWGAGLGRGLIDEDGDWHALYAMGFSDSHRNFQPLAGYGFQKRLRLFNKTYLGAGYTWFVTSRQDIWGGIPFPGFPLPMVSVTASRLSVYATYVPGKRNIGNVLFVFGKWTF